MSFCDHERFQTHCRFCFKILEADSTEEALALAEEHEQTDCEKNGTAKKKEVAPCAPK